MPVFVSEQFGSSWLINDTSNSWKGTSASAAIFRATSISYARKVLLGPEQAGRGILSTREAYQSGFFFMFHIFLVFSTWFSKHTEKETFLFGCKDTFFVDN